MNLPSDYYFWILLPFSSPFFVLLIILYYVFFFLLISFFLFFIRSTKADPGHNRQKVPAAHNNKPTQYQVQAMKDGRNYRKPTPAAIGQGSPPSKATSQVMRKLM